MATISEALKTAAKYYSTNRLQQAEQIYNRILETIPEQADALHGMGLLTLKKGEPENAKTFFEIAIKVEPNVFKHWFALGNFYQSQREFDLAVDAYHKALAIEPKLASIYNNLGYALQELDKYPEAIASYQKALEIQPDCTEANVNLGNILYERGQLPQDKKPEYAQLNHQLGITYQQAENLNYAITYFQKAIDLQPKNWEYYYSLGKLFQEQEQLEAAIKSYNQALKLNPNNWNIYNSLGQTYQVQKKLPEAIAIYRQGLNLLNPDYASAITTCPNCNIQTTPAIIQETIKVGDYQFPAILPVTELEKARPFWTVVIPIYKRNDYILECLANVLLQWSGKADMEILVIDNASTSPLYELVNSLGGGIINYYRNSENIGPANNMNMGIYLSRGEWVHVLHDDDSVSPGFYSQLQQSLKNSPENIGAACTGFEYANENGKTVRLGEINSLPGQQKGILQNWLSRIGVCGFVMTPALVIRRKTHEKLGGYNPEIPNINDWELHKRIAAFYEWWYEPQVLARFRIHSNTETSESWNSGKMAVQVEKAINISQSYLPIDSRAEITARARIQNFNYCLTHALIPLKNGNLQGTLNIIQLSLKIDNTSQSIAKLFQWLTQEETLPVREFVASNLIALKI